MKRKRPWCKRAVLRSGIKTPSRRLFLHATWIYDTGFLLFIGLVYPFIVVSVFAILDMYRSSRYANLSQGQYLVSFGLYGVIPAVLLGNVLLVIGKQRISKELILVRCQRCPKCFHDLLQREPGDSQCPGCGETVPRRECVRLWCKLLRSRL